MTSTNWTYIKNNWISILLLLVFLWVMFKPSGCGPDLPWEKQPTRDTVTSTVYVPQPPVYIDRYTPIQSGATSYPVIIPDSRQPATDITALTKQYNELIREFLASRTYRDSIQLKDTSGRRVGVVNLVDVVSENKIQSREPNYQLSFPHTTTTITIREPYQPRNQLFIGGGLTGNTVSPVNGVNIGLLYKTKRDRIFNVTAGGQAYDGRLVPQFGLSSYWKLSFKK